MKDRMTAPRSQRSSDRGFTLVELVIVLVLLGVFATVVVSAVFNFREDADGNSCRSDARTLQIAAEAYKAQRGVAQLPATGASADRYEMSLVAENFLRDVSTLHDLDEDGYLVAVDGSPCTLN